MVFKADKLRLRKLLMDAISLLCKNGLPVQAAFRIEATIGITLSEDEVVLVSFREIVQPDGAMVPAQTLSEDEASDEASGILTDADDNDGEDTKKAEKEMALKGPSQSSVHHETRSELEEESSAWSEMAEASDSPCVRNSASGNTATVGNSSTVRNCAVRKQCAADDDNLKCPSLGPDVHYEESLVQASCSSTDHGSYNNVSSHIHNNNRERSNLDVHIKDEVIDDEDCTFVKMEDGSGADVFDPLVPEDSWMYQVYNETNLYSNPSNELSQFTQGQDYDETPSGHAPASHELWTASSRDCLRSSQSRRSVSGAPQGGGLARSGVRQSLPVSSRNQVMSMSLCQNILHQSTIESSGRYVCPICQARLGNIQTLRNHIKKTHLALKIERCRTCGAAFRWASQLARHKKREHGHLDPGVGPSSYYSAAQGPVTSGSLGVQSFTGETLEAPCSTVTEGQRYTGRFS